ncbi:MAG TPA: Gfo/Idh/MocA family oxidoreductase [Gemmatimonadaceae bacterium]|nr:Gfo/Idh/MocA family oxidoreductase [Gemmatimonadaceae bacterium]
MQTVRVGVLGCGGIARVAHLPSLARTPGAQVVAIADPDAACLGVARTLAPDARAVAEYGDVLAMPDVDAVIVALPPALHAEATIAALEHGKHVYVEKPLATSEPDGARVVAAWRATSLTAMMGFNYRFNPIVREARARIAAGEIGALVGARSVFTTPPRALAPWKQRRDTGGGVLLDLAVHHIDLIRYLLGADVTSVFAELRSDRTEHDSAFVQLGLTTGQAQCMFSLNAVDDDRIEIFGSNARLTIDRYRSLRVEVASGAGGAIGGAVARAVGEARALPYALAKLRSPLNDPSFPAAIGAFVQAVRERTAASPDLHDGYRALAVVDAAERSAQSGRVAQ